MKLGGGILHHVPKMPPFPSTPFEQLRDYFCILNQLSLSVLLDLHCSLEFSNHGFDLFHSFIIFITFFTVL